MTFVEKHIGFAAAANLERETEAIECPACHGFAGRVDCTQQEIDEVGCGRDVPGFECCARAFVCKRCGARYVCRAPAPEMERSL
jgi:hypothetical protein